MARLESDGILARGGMGWVYRVFDADIGRYAALKVMDDAIQADPEAQQRFLAEARICGQLEHPNIPAVYELALTEEGRPKHFTMRLIDGLPLSQHLDPGRVADRSEAELWRLLGIFLKVCDAVGYAHGKRVVHCDIKPDNVVIGNHGEVYVVDWGIALRLGDSESLAPEMQGRPAGTYAYMAPEQAWGRLDEIDPRTDVFGLGALLYEILTGRAPYAGGGMQVVERARAGDVKRPQEVAPEGAYLPPALCAIALRALARRREDRYPDVESLRADVERAMRGGLSLDQRVFAPGALILREGDAADAAYIIVRGRCEAFHATPDGGRTVLRTMGPGDVFGELALVSAQPRSASVVALEEVTAMVLTRAAFEREVRAESWLARLLTTLVERFREAEASRR